MVRRDLERLVCTRVGALVVVLLEVAPAKRHTQSIDTSPSYVVSCGIISNLVNLAQALTDTAILTYVLVSCSTPPEWVTIEAVDRIRGLRAVAVGGVPSLCDA